MYNKQIIIYLLIFVNISISLQIGPLPFSARRTDIISSQSCGRTGWSCKDCSTLQRCGPDGIAKFEISCGSQYPDRPYCDPRIGRCVSDRHVCSEMKDPEFICPDAGIYPDLTDCRRYISCRAEGEIGLIYSCLFQSVYNPKAKRCITNSICYNSINECNGQYKTMPYNADPSLYIVCRADQKPLIKDCGSKMFEYDPNLLACDFKCREEGQFADPTNKTLYYICIFNENEIVRMMGLCLEGTKFDENYGTCVFDFDINTTTEVIEETTELVTELGTTLVNEEQNSEVATENIETTIIEEILETSTTEDSTLGQETTTENLFTEETTISSNLEEFTTTYIEDEITTIEDSSPDPGISTEETTTANLITEEIITTTIADTTGNIEEETVNTEDASPGQDTTTETPITEEIITTIPGLEEFTTSNIEEETTITKDASPGQDTTTENHVTEEISTTTNTTTTSNIEEEITTKNNSSEESLETTEKYDTNEETVETNEDTEETKEINSNEDKDSNQNSEATNENKTKEKSNESKENNTKEDTEEIDSTEDTEETTEINSNEDEEKETNEKSEITKEISNESKDEKYKCVGRICIPKWKFPGFKKRNNTN